jgi:hypothetical protein
MFLSKLQLFSWQPVTPTPQAPGTPPEQPGWLVSLTGGIVRLRRILPPANSFEPFGFGLSRICCPCVTLFVQPPHASISLNFSGSEQRFGSGLFSCISKITQIPHTDFKQIQTLEAGQVCATIFAN